MLFSTLLQEAPRLALDPLTQRTWGAPGSAGAADITVVIATIPPRAALLSRALASVALQTLQPAAIVVSYDHTREGAAATKNAAIEAATTEWVAPLDDDDFLLPDHLAQLWNAQRGSRGLDDGMGGDRGADVVYSVPHIPQIPGFRDPDGRYGQPFDAAELRRRSYIQTTSLLRREMVQSVGGFQVPDVVVDPADPRRNYDDWGMYKKIEEIGGTFVHVPVCTFVWNHWGYGEPGRPGNTSGDPSRW